MQETKQVHGNNSYLKNHLRLKQINSSNKNSPEQTKKNRMFYSKASQSFSHFNLKPLLEHSPELKTQPFPQKNPVSDAKNKIENFINSKGNAKYRSDPTFEKVLQENRDFRDKLKTLKDENIKLSCQLKKSEQTSENLFQEIKNLKYAKEKADQNIRLLKSQIERYTEKGSRVNSPSHEVEYWKNKFREIEFYAENLRKNWDSHKKKHEEMTQTCSELQESNQILQQQLQETKQLSGNLESQNKTLEADNIIKEKLIQHLSQEVNTLKANKEFKERLDTESLDLIENLQEQLKAEQEKKYLMDESIEEIRPIVEKSLKFLESLSETAQQQQQKIIVLESLENETWNVKSLVNEISKKNDSFFESLQEFSSYLTSECMEQSDQSYTDRSNLSSSSQKLSAESTLVNFNNPNQYKLLYDEFVKLQEDFNLIYDSHVLKEDEIKNLRKEIETINTYFESQVSETEGDESQETLKTEYEPDVVESERRETQFKIITQKLFRARSLIHEKRPIFEGSEFDKLNDCIEKFKSKSKSLKTQVKTLTQKVMDLESQLHHQESLNKKLKPHFCELIRKVNLKDEQIESLHSEIQKLIDKNKNLSSKYEELTRNIQIKPPEELKNWLKNSSNEEKEPAETRRQSGSVKQILSENLRRAKERCQTLQSQNEVLRDALQDMMNRYEKLEFSAKKEKHTQESCQNDSTIKGLISRYEKNYL